MAPIRPSAPPPSDPSGLSELIRDFELETRFLNGDATQHFFYRRGTSSENRRRKVVETWVRVKRLGSGSYGSVWLERCKEKARKDGPSVRAVKEIRMDSRAGFTAHRELEAIFTFSHNRYEPCFVKSYGWFRTSDAIFITMEYISHGDLRCNLRGPLPEQEAQTIAWQLLEGLKYMHDKSFVHRDLKPENILVVSSGPNWLVQLCDFGLTRRLEEGSVGTMRQGTLGYIAPELLGFVAEKRYPFAVDMWSLGCVIYRVLTGREFLVGVDDVREYVNGQAQFPRSELDRVNLSEAGMGFVRQLLKSDPGARLTAAAAAEHKWMLDAARESLLTSTETDDAGCSTASPSRNPTLGSNVLRSTRSVQRSMPSAQWSWQTTNPNALGLIDDRILNHVKNALGDGEGSTTGETNAWATAAGGGEDREKDTRQGGKRTEEDEARKKVEGEESYEAEDEKEEVESDEEDEGTRRASVGKLGPNRQPSLSSLITTFKGLEVGHSQRCEGATSSGSDTIGPDTPVTRLSSLSVHSGAMQKRPSPRHEQRDTLRDLLVGPSGGQGRQRRRLENRIRDEKRLRDNNHYRINKQRRAPPTSRNPIASPPRSRQPLLAIEPYRNRQPTRSNRGTASRPMGETGFLEGIPSKIANWLSWSFSVFTVIRKREPSRSRADHGHGAA
ncbi:hypothetical protein VTJ83DRAFT_3663 [Remersonia thermophila]|uniref:Autophagy-related protein 1 n=1 Tax=Remersonia thermophila TaxID=72144 RepID=A0ABR4DGU5_9PEZI